MELRNLKMQKNLAYPLSCLSLSSSSLLGSCLTDCIAFLADSPHRYLQIESCPLIDEASNFRGVSERNLLNVGKMPSVFRRKLIELQDDQGIEGEKL